MTASDKFTVNRRAYTAARQVLRTLCIDDAANKSVPRTRKEKCQTKLSACGHHGLRCRPNVTLLEIRLHFMSFWGFKPQLRPGLRLTNLMVARQICQTRLTQRLQCLCSSDISDTPLSEMSDDQLR
jgi:hypothetical protein